MKVLWWAMYIPALVEPSLPGLPMAALRKTARKAYPILTKAIAGPSSDLI